MTSSSAIFILRPFARICCRSSSIPKRRDEQVTSYSFSPHATCFVDTDWMTNSLSIFLSELVVSRTRMYCQALSHSWFVVNFAVMITFEYFCSTASAVCCASDDDVMVLSVMGWPSNIPSVYPSMVFMASTETLFFFCTRIGMTSLY